MLTLSKRLLACICVITAISLTSCQDGDVTNAPPATGSANPPSAEVERIKPAPGTGNVQGKVLYDGQPVENIEVTLCEEFSQYLGGCSGKTYTARTDKNGEYVITNVEPNAYEGLLVRVFDTDMYIFSTSGIGGLSSTTYEVSADKTLFVEPTHLFKVDLKVLNPKAGAKVSAQNLELSWESYPEAAYYQFSLYPEDVTVASPYVNERVEGTSFVIDKPLPQGTYRWQVEAYNSADRKLSESSSDMKFTITDGASP